MIVYFLQYFVASAAFLTAFHSGPRRKKSKIINLITEASGY